MKQKKTLLAFWDQLVKTERLSLLATSWRNETQSIKTGRAEVETFLPTSSVLIFQEKGIWFQEQQIVFSNSFRWTLDRNNLLITLEHLRYGANHPVFLFHLTPTQPYMLESVDAHLCGEDTYLGNIAWNHAQIDFHWKIIGPNKNDHLIYRYSCAHDPPIGNEYR